MGDEGTTLLVGALARVSTDHREEIRVRLDAIEGVEPFDLDDPAKLGVLVEARSADHAVERLRREVEPLEGVLGVWPVSLHATGSDDLGAACAGHRAAAVPTDGGARGDASPT